MQALNSKDVTNRVAIALPACANFTTLLINEFKTLTVLEGLLRRRDNTAAIISAHTTSVPKAEKNLKENVTMFFRRAISTYSDKWSDFNVGIGRQFTIFPKSFLITD